MRSLGPVRGETDQDRLGVGQEEGKRGGVGEGGDREEMGVQARQKEGEGTRRRGEELD